MDRMHIFRADPSLWGRLRRQIALSTRRNDDAADLLHSAYVKLQEHDGPPVQNAEAFLVRTAVNLAYDEQRQRRRRRTDDLDALSIESIADGAPLQDEILHARQRLNALRLMLDRLQPRTRQILLMHRVDGLRYREIAERLGISESAVEKHMAKGALVLHRASRRRDRVTSRSL